MPYGYTAQAPDYSFIGRAASDLGAGIAGGMQAAEKRKALREKMANLKLDMNKVEQARQVRIQEAVGEYNEATGNSSPKQALAFVSKYYTPLVGSERNDPLKAVERWSIADDKFYKKMGELKEIRDRQGASAGLRDILNRESAGAGQPIVDQPGTGQPATRQGALGRTPSDSYEKSLSREPPIYQHQAARRYGEAAATGDVPYRTTKQLQEDPLYSSLFKYDPYREAELKLKERREQRRRIERGRGDVADRDKNTRWIIDTGLDLQSDKNRFNKEAAAIEKAILKIQQREELSVEDSQALEDAGIPMPDLTSVDKLREHYHRVKNLITETEYDIQRNKQLEKYYTAGGTLGGAARRSQQDIEEERERKKQEEGKRKQELRGRALTELRTRMKTDISPSLLYTNPEYVIEALPPNLQEPVREMVKESRDIGSTDDQIMNILRQVIGTE